MALTHSCRPSWRTVSISFTPMGCSISTLFALISHFGIVYTSHSHLEMIIYLTILYFSAQSVILHHEKKQLVKNLVIAGTGVNNDDDMTYYINLLEVKNLYKIICLNLFGSYWFLYLILFASLNFLIIILIRHRSHNRKIANENFHQRKKELRKISNN